jgi:hypothetical protein
MDFSLIYNHGPYPLHHAILCLQYVLVKALLKITVEF